MWKIETTSRIANTRARTIVAYSMDGRTIFVSLSHGSLVGLSLFGAVNSYTAITKLQGYEETTKKLAKWSTTVEQELYKTRTTQGSGAIAVRLFQCPNLNPSAP
jgi:hypothetical protein